MPGIVGLVHHDGISLSIAESLKKLMHLPTYCSHEFDVGYGIRLGQVWRHRKAKQGEWYFDKGSQSGVLLNGAMMKSSPLPHKVTSQEVLQSFHQHGFTHWSDYEGGFIAVIVDLTQRKLFIANDRLGTLPLYYTQTKEMFCFGPEVKAVLTALKRAPVFSTSGLITFLAGGFCLGATTLFEDIHYLKPGSLLSLDMAGFTLTRSQIWNLQYESSKELESRGPAREALFEAMKSAHKVALCDRPRRFDLLLSGGMDSRGILGVLDQLGHLPARALSWGLRDDLPYSDARIAHQMADEFHVPFHFRSYTSDDIPEHAENWCYLSELANDNLGWYSEGPSVLLDHYDVTADFSLKGDESWGIRGWVNSEEEARSAFMPSSLPPALCRVLRSGRIGEFQGIYDQEIRKITHNYMFQSWVDYKDYLYLYGRVARFIFSMGYYKELATEIRRPFLGNDVIEVVRRLPAKFRVYKNLYLEVLSHYLPRTMFVPDNIVNSLPDWPYDICTRPHLRQFWEDLCDVRKIENGVLGGLIDTESFIALRDTFFSGVPQPIRRSTSLVERTKKEWRETIAQSRLWARLKRFRPQQSPSGSFSPFPILSRIALVVLLEKQLPRLSR
jgi:hypothetical protein